MRIGAIHRLPEPVLDDVADDEFVQRLLRKDIDVQLNRLPHVHNLKALALFVENADILDRRFA